MFTMHRHARNSIQKPSFGRGRGAVQGPDGELVALKLHRLGHGHSVWQRVTAWHLGGCASKSASEVESVSEPSRRNETT